MLTRLLTTHYVQCRLALLSSESLLLLSDIQNVKIISVFALSLWGVTFALPVAVPTFAEGVENGGGGVEVSIEM